MNDVGDMALAPFALQRLGDEAFRGFGSREHENEAAHERQTAQRSGQLSDDEGNEDEAFEVDKPVPTFLACYSILKLLHNALAPIIISFSVVLNGIRLNKLLVGLLPDKQLVNQEACPLDPWNTFSWSIFCRSTFSPAALSRIQVSLHRTGTRCELLQDTVREAPYIHRTSRNLRFCCFLMESKDRSILIG
jgi:hypothetical protein